MDIVTIRNDALSVSICKTGGELMSLRDSDGTEYLWQGDSAVWGGRAPNLFPFIGRLKDSKYTYKGKEYSIRIHGFLPKSEMTLVSAKPDSCVLALEANEETRRVYPFDFSLNIEYTLSGRMLSVRYTILNRSAEPMYFALGGHPGFNIPLESGSAFEDWYAEFPNCGDAVKVEFDDGVLVACDGVPVQLENNCLPLRRELFSRDAYVLRGYGGCVALKSEKSGRYVCMHCEDFPYLGLWQIYGRGAQYLCLEPWSALPGRHGVIEELTTMPGLTELAPGGRHELKWSAEAGLAAK